MATATLPDTITNDTPADADEVQGNFEYLAAFVNDEVIHADGSKAFTALPSAPTSSPSSDAQLMTRAAHKARSGVLAKRVHAATSLFITHEGITSTGIVLPSFTMPTLSGDVGLLIECYIPQVEVGSYDGWPPNLATLQWRLRTASDSTVAFGRQPVAPANAFLPDQVPSCYFQNQLWDNSLLTAGSTVSLTLKGEVTGENGKAQIVGTAQVPCVITARLIG